MDRTLEPDEITAEPEPLMGATITFARHPTIAPIQYIPEVDYARMALEQKTDPLVQQLRANPGSLKLTEVVKDGNSILCDISTSRMRPVVPPSMTIFSCC